MNHVKLTKITFSHLVVINIVDINIGFIRPPDIHVGGLMFYHGSCFFFFFLSFLFGL